MAEDIPESYFEIVFKHAVMKVKRWSFKDYLYQDILCYSLPIQHTDNTVTVTCIMFTVRNHNDGGTLFIQVCKHFHYLVTV